MIEKFSKKAAPLTREPPGIGMLLVHSCSFCHKRTSLPGGGFISVRPGSRVKLYACITCKRDRLAADASRAAQLAQAGAEAGASAIAATIVVDSTASDISGDAAQSPAKPLAPRRGGRKSQQCLPPPSLFNFSWPAASKDTPTE